MAKYLKVIGIFELMIAAIGLIFYTLSMVRIFSSSYGTDAVTKFATIFGFVAYIFFAPAVGILFICSSELIERLDNLEIMSNEPDDQTTIDSDSSQSDTNNIPLDPLASQLSRASVPPKKPKINDWK